MPSKDLERERLTETLQKGTPEFKIIRVLFTR